MGRKIDADDLIDAQEVADILGLAQRNSVATYLKRYPEMPRPVVDRRGSQVRLWLRSEILAWARERKARD